MKKSLSFTLLTVAVLTSIVLSACGTASSVPAADQPSQSGPKSQAVAVAFTGPVESINGNQWVVDSQTVTVEPGSLPDAKIQVGDLVKVEGVVGLDGAITTTHVASPTVFNGFAAPASNQSAYPNPTGTPETDNGEVSGVIEAITDTSVTIDGVTYLLTNLSEVDGLLAVGDQVEIHFVANPDGTMTILEIERTSHSGNGNENENGNVNSNDNGNENVNGNGNGNGNENVNSDDDNENEDDDDSNSNGNENDDDSDNGNSNSNHADNGHRDSNGNGNGNGG